MFFSIDSTFKRAIFIAVTVAIGIILIFTAFFFRPNLNQQTLVVYLLLLQAIMFASFFRNRDHTTSRAIYVKKLKNPRLQENAFAFSEILMKEYDYCRETAKQAMNDRHTMVNYFIIIVGAIITILGGIYFESFQQFSSYTLSILSVSSVAVSIIGWIYIMHIIRLRQAWHDSAAAMNRIKDFYIINGRVPDDIARSAFAWDTKTLPKKGKKSNIFYYSVMLISFISSIAFFIACWLISPAAQINSLSMFTCVLGVYHFFFQMSCYALFLDYEPIR